MTNIVCIVSIVINVNGIFVEATPEQLKGRLIKESDAAYLVDFSEAIKEYPLTADPKKYKELIVEKNRCVKL